MKVLNLPIQMISSFDIKGIPTPHKFKVTYEDEAQTIKIDKILYCEREKVAGKAKYSYRCQSIIEDVLKIYELKFDLSTCAWFLYKM